MKYLLLFFLCALFKFGVAQESDLNKAQIGPTVSFKQDMRELYLEIYFTDQHFRKHLYERNEAFISKKNMIRLINKTDSVNAVRIMNLIKKNNGFPTVDDIGNNQLYFAIYHVSAFLNMDFIIEEIRKATLSGKLYNSYGPQLIDYIRRSDDLKGLYGIATFINKDGKKQYKEIEDIKNVDKRRAEFLLPPLYQQARIDTVILPINYSSNYEK